MKIQGILLLFLVVTLFFIVSLTVRFNDNKVDRVYESPKLYVVNPFWKEVKKFCDNVNFYLFVRDLIRCCHLNYHLVGYLDTHSSTEFSKAVVEAERITGKKHKMYEWERGKLVRINEIGLVLVLEK